MADLRCSWGKVGCPVYVATAYRSSWMKELFGCSAESVKTATLDSEYYGPAKTENDSEAALQICRRALDKAYRARVKLELRTLERKGYKDPIVVAPCKPNSNNALARTAAEFLAKKLKIDVDTDIHEIPCSSRRNLDRRAKFFERPKFSGKVQRGRLYILIDDMVTTGATLAELRSHIIKNGGNVAFACSLASCDGIDKQLHPDQDNLSKVQNVFAGLEETVRNFLQTNLGMSPESMTDAEASFLASGKGQYALEQYTQSINPM